MASPDTQNVVVNSQSMGDSSSIDTNAQIQHTAPAAAGTPADTSATDLSSDKHDADNIPQVLISASPLFDEQSHGHGNGGDGDTVSVQGSLAGDSVRDASSVADTHDLSVGSDTDTSRADATEQGKDGSGALKSVKKPTTFKAVSVTRSFLAKTATVSTTPKLGEKPAPSLGATLTMARPRLVAKSGSGMRDSPGPRSGNDSPAGGATVWNKNRPAPPPPTKHFTDEELKQQYGIHLASRLQADDDNSTNNKAKWADMDDDEDDWAPETLEWMDGTKSTINPEPLSAPVAKPAASTATPPPPEIKPTLTALKRPVPTGPPKTVLRPGAALEQAKQELANARDAQAQKPSSGPKTPAPVPTKSPWASLPPVDKAAPLTDFETLQAPQPPRQTLGSQDARMMDGSFQAREMEADTFDRAWRESDRGPRELFNSQNGRYEPAPEGRRGSMRREQGYKGPSVLRRPSQSGGSEAVMDSYHPRGAAADGSPWARRRGSSISQEPHAFERRVSVTQKSADGNAPADNRTGIVIGHDIGPQARQAQQQTPQQQADDRQEEVLRQKKIMQEKRELAIRRRKEQDEQEEAAKRERIRLKLESLGMQPTKTEPSAPTQRAAGETAHPGDQPHVKSTTGAQQTSGGAANDNAPARAEQQAVGRSDHVSPQHGRALLSQSPEKAQAAVNLPSHNTQESGNLSSIQSTDTKHTPFRSPGLSADTFATWGHRSGQAANVPGSNVWGPPGSLRHIGNGAFGSAFPRVPPRMQSQGLNLGQNPSFPTAGRSVSSGTRQETSPMRHQQMLSDQNLAALGLVDTPMPDYPPAMSSAAGDAPQQTPLSPIAPPARPKPFYSSIPSMQAAIERMKYREEFENPAAEAAMRAEQEAIKAQGGSTWKTISRVTRVVNGRREVVSTTITHSDPPKPPGLPAPPVTDTQQPAIAPIPGAESRQSTVRLPSVGVVAPPTGQIKAPSPSATTPSGNQSRFFPSGMVGGGSPPPEGSSHPVYSGDRSKPKVNLPTPKPNVRLPPAALEAMQAQQQPSVIMPERSNSFRGAQPLVQSSDWQARFNGLFGRIQTTTTVPPSPPRTPPKTAAIPSAAPISSTRVNLPNPAQSATVSLPFQTPTPAAQGTTTTKPTVDDIFDGELSFGSTPKVRVPRSPTYTPAPDRRGLHILQMRPNAKFDRRVESLSLPGPPAERTASIAVHMPGEAQGKEVSVSPAVAKRIFSTGEERSKRVEGEKVRKPRGAVKVNKSRAEQGEASA